MTAESRAGGHPPVKSHKDAYNERRRGESPLLTEPKLRSMFPEAAGMYGQLGETGVVLFNNSGDILGTVTSPLWIPTPGRVKEGGPQREIHVNRWSMRDLGIDKERQIASKMLERAKMGVSIGWVGKEREGWLHSSHNMAHKVSISVPHDAQIETNRGMLEIVMDPQVITEIEHMRTSEHITARTEAFIARELFFSENSVPMFGDPTIPALRLNNGAEREYIRFIHRRKLKQLANARDPYARQLGDYVATRYGENSKGGYRYKDYDAMRADQKGVPYWAVSGLHRSAQLKDIDGPDATGFVPSRLAIALADIQASDMGVIPQLLSMSTPVIYQDNPLIIREDGEERWPKDYRAISQLFLDTAYPGESIRDYETLNTRIARGMKEGHIPSPGRGAFFNKESGAFTYHGAARIRCDTFGGIENTSRGATQSLLDEFAGDFLLDLFAISAAEAVSEGKTLQEYLGGKYGGSMVSNTNRLAITHGYNLHDSGLDRALPENVSKQIDFCLSYLEDMRRKYPEYGNKIERIKDRVINMTRAAQTDSLKDYYYNPVGPFADVVKNAVESELYVSEVELVKIRYQNRVAKSHKEVYDQHYNLPSGWDKEFARMTQMAQSFA